MNRQQSRPDAPLALATMTRDADALVFRGALLRGVVTRLWRQAQPLRAGIARLDLTAVSEVDSAGLALLVALARPGATDTVESGPRDAAAGASGDGICVLGAPAGLAELRAAYRLDDRLAFAG